MVECACFFGEKLVLLYSLIIVTCSFLVVDCIATSGEDLSYL